MTQTHAHAFRISVDPAPTFIRLRRLATPMHYGLLLAAVMLVTAGTAKAAGSSMPWEGPL
ncbi:MAG: conjugal transfer protein TrbC, partial [Paraburkholderia tropica]